MYPAPAPGAIYAAFALLTALHQSPRDAQLHLKFAAYLVRSQR